MNKKVIICCGISGSGKSTFAKKLCKENNSFIRINRDDIRKGLVGDLDGYYLRKDLKICEDMVTDIENCIFELCSFASKNIVIDNTNLNKKHIEKWIELASEFKYEVEFKFFDCDLNKAKERVLKRDFNINIVSVEKNGRCLSEDEYISLINIESPGVKYVDKQFQQYQQIKKEYES